MSSGGVEGAVFVAEAVDGACITHQIREIFHRCCPFLETISVLLSYMLCTENSRIHCQAIPLFSASWSHRCCREEDNGKDKGLLARRLVGSLQFQWLPFLLVGSALCFCFGHGFYDVGWFPSGATTSSLRRLSLTVFRVALRFFFLLSAYFLGGF